MGVQNMYFGGPGDGTILGASIGNIWGPAVTNASGIATFSVDCSKADHLFFLHANVYACVASGGHLASAGVWACEYAVTNKGGVVAALTPVASSANPQNASNLVAARSEAADSAFGTSTMVWSLSSTNAVLTATLLSGGGAPQAGVNVWAVIWAEMCGAT